MSRRKPRSLRPEEEALWETIAARTKPLHQKRTILPKAPAAQPDPKPKQAPALKPFKIGSNPAQKPAKPDLAPTPQDRLASLPIQMDKKAFGRLKRGKLSPDARIDLHGMTLSQAHPALNGFITASHARGHRLVLVITGKGKDRDYGGPIPERRGMLRHQVPQWLRMAPLGPLILQVTPAHIKHGGLGAYYVYLRRRR